MDFEYLAFLNVLREVWHGLQEDGSQQQPMKVGGVNVNDLPKFIGGFDLEEYLDQEEKIEKGINFKGWMIR